jgi:hypothetical protein
LIFVKNIAAAGMHYSDHLGGESNEHACAGWRWHA